MFDLLTDGRLPERVFVEPGFTNPAATYRVTGQGRALTRHIHHTRPARTAHYVPLYPRAAGGGVGSGRGSGNLEAMVR